MIPKQNKTKLKKSVPAPDQWKKARAAKYAQSIGHGAGARNAIATLNDSTLPAGGQQRDTHSGTPFFCY